MKKSVNIYTMQAIRFFSVSHFLIWSKARHYADQPDVVYKTPHPVANIPVCDPSVDMENEWSKYNQPQDAHTIHTKDWFATHLYQDDSLSLPTGSFEINQDTIEEGYWLINLIFDELVGLVMIY